METVYALPLDDLKAGAVLLGFQLVNQVHQSLHAAPQAIKFPDHKGIGFAQVGQRFFLAPDVRPARR